MVVRSRRFKVCEVTIKNRIRALYSHFSDPAGGAARPRIFRGRSAVLGAGRNEQFVDCRTRQLKPRSSRKSSDTSISWENWSSSWLTRGLLTLTAGGHSRGFSNLARPFELHHDECLVSWRRPPDRLVFTSFREDVGANTGLVSALGSCSRIMCNMGRPSRT